VAALIPVARRTPAIEAVLKMHWVIVIVRALGEAIGMQTGGPRRQDSRLGARQITNWKLLLDSATVRSSSSNIKAFEINSL
jgi:hypothetical protein